MMTSQQTTMQRLSWTLLCLLVALTVVRAQDECTLYLAVSSTSTKEEPIWGVYAGVDFDENAQLGAADVAIQMHNIMNHAMDQQDDEEDDEDEKSTRRKTVELIERFTWVADSSGGLLELREGRKINTAIPGPPLLAAYDIKFVNAAFNHTAAFFRPYLGESPGKAHPGRGASSHFYNTVLRSTKVIPAGGELFLDYGQNFQSTEEVRLTVDDYNKVDHLIDSIIQFMDKYKDELNDDSKLEIYNFLVDDVMKAAAGTAKAKLVSELLPNNPGELPLVKEAGGSLMFGSTQVKRDLEWLQKEGFCMDNLVVKASTIPHAGRGAFARRNLPKGATVAPIPLLHIPDKSIVDMHDLEEDDEKLYRKSIRVVDQQLFLNYALGHPESSMLFFPTGAVVPVINHSQEPNVKLVWSKHSHHTPQWFDKEPEELVEDEYSYIGLLMELVATRDIKEDEEVLLDYGKEWQEAWDAHVKDWDAKLSNGAIKSEWPIRAFDLNQEYRTRPFETQAELKENPYPDHVATHCFLSVKAEADHNVEIPLPWVEPSNGSIYTADHLYACQVQDRKAIKRGSYNYTVTTGKEFPVTVTNVPHKAIIFMDMPETSDQFFKGSFRHVIGIPDDIFPKGAWRDLAKET